MQTILVTGATGTVGSSAVAELSKLGGVKVRVATRDPQKAPAGTEGVLLAWDRPATFAAALAGVDAVLLITPFVDNAVELATPFIAAAKAAGVKKLVKLSAAGVESEAFPLAQWHRAVERLVEGSGAAWVTLRPSFFDTNFVGYYPPDAEGSIYLPTGDGKAGWIDPRDIGAVAARVLTRPDWDNRALVLTGPEALSIADIAQRIGEATGRSIRHVDVPEDAARGAMAGLGMPPWMVQASLDLYNVIKQGWAAGLTTTVKDVTGQAPRTFAAFAKDHAAAWKK